MRLSLGLGIGIMSPVFPTTAAAVVAATTWNPSDKDATATLSNGNLTISTAGGGDWYAARATTALTSNQKSYHEITIDGTTWGSQFGHADGTQGLHVGLGATPSHSYCVSQGQKTFNCVDSPDHAANVFTTAPTLNDNIGIAFDSSLGKVWFRKNGGSWNEATGGTQNPATGQGGLTVPFSGPYKAIGNVQAAGAQISAKFSSSSWTYTVPAGFSQIAA